MRHTNVCLHVLVCLIAQFRGRVCVCVALVYVWRQLFEFWEVAP